MQLICFFNIIGIQVESLKHVNVAVHMALTNTYRV